MIAYRDKELITKVSSTFFTLAGFGSPWIPYYSSGRAKTWIW